MKTLIILLSLITFSVSSETRLIIPLATTHVGGSYDFNNHNPGAGIEYKNDLIYSAVYSKYNSFHNESIYLSVSKPINHDNLTLTYGASLANGYENFRSSGYVIFPVFSAEYNNFRLVTSYPFVNLTSDTPHSGDFFNIQYVHKF